MRSVERNQKRAGLRLLTAALLASAMAVPNSAQAASWFWGPGPVYGPGRGYSMVPRAMQHKPRSRAPKATEQLAEKHLPEGPLIIAISIQHQHLKVFDVNGLFAETPISTGMAGHSTPMGVFSVIEKQRWHRSNIYSGAPMPYMQRITWSGVAMHEGVLPGYPASHGCIRMPGAFAVKMFSWTKRGARVIVVPGDISIEEFSHPKLIAHMLEEKPFASLAPAKGAARDALLIDKADDVKPELKLATLADASGSNLPLTRHAVSDDGKIADTAASDSQSDVTQPTTPTRTEHSVVATDAPAMMPTKEMAAVQTVEETIDRAAAMVEAAPVQLDAPHVASDTAAPETTATAAAKPAEPPPTPKPDLAAVPVSKPNTASDTAAPAAPPSVPSQTATAPATDPNDIPTVIAPKRTGHVAVFISRKDRRLYVRQNFSPVFDVPITISDPDKPFGTFVFTARGDKDDAAALRWSVVAMPYAVKKTVAMSVARPGKKARSVVETSLAAPPSTAAEALDRITVPDWALQRVAEAIRPGGSLIISDHGLGDETGEGTDFIVPLR
jgi:lipoprotein-anchoring transpeptidase ErfK/SrfK